MIPHHSKRLEVLADTCAERAWRVAAALLGDPHEAYDAVQQAYLVAARKAEQIPASDPWPWFAQVVAFEARNLRRRKRPSSHPDGQPESADPMAVDPAAEAERHETRESLQAALRGLPWKEREAITLTRVAGLSHDEAARLMDMPRKTLTSHVLRGVDRLRESLGRRGEEVSTMLGVLPLAMPVGGMEAAAAGWKSAAVASVGTGSAVAGTAVVGGAMAMKQAMLVGGMALALGLAGGYLAKDVMAEDPAPVTPSAPTVSVDEFERVKQEAASAGQREREARADRAKELEKAQIDRDAAVALAKSANQRAESLDAAVGTLRADLDKALQSMGEVSKELVRTRADMDALKIELAEVDPNAGERAPVFTFGTTGQIDGVLNANWKEIAVASKAVGDAIARRYQARAAGKAPSNDDALIQQENTERVRKYEYRTIGKIPSWAKHNGELTHPISLANTLAAMLRDAGDPLTEAQIAQITKLGLAWEEEDASRRRLYGENTPRSLKMFEEYVTKGAFTDSLYAELTPRQRELVVNPVTHRRAGLDLLCPTLLILHTTPIVNGANIDEIKGKVVGVLAKAYGMDEGLKAQLVPLVDAWGLEVAGLLDPVAKADERHYSYQQGVVAGRAMANLHQQMLALLKLPEAGKAALLDDYTWFLPRVVKAGE